MLKAIFLDKDVLRAALVLAATTVVTGVRLAVDAKRQLPP